MPLIIPVVLIAVAYSTGRLRPYEIPTTSMEPAIRSGDRVIAEGISYWLRAPRRGEIIVFPTQGIPTFDQVPGLSSKRNIQMKRLAGLPGDHLEIRDGKLLVNGEPTQLTPGPEPIEYQAMGELRPGSVVIVPENTYFVLGDNSFNSADSRIWGVVPAKNVLSRVIWRYWPLDRTGRVE